MSLSRTRKQSSSSAGSLKRSNAVHKSKSLSDQSTSSPCLLIPAFTGFDGDFSNFCTSPVSSCSDDDVSMTDASDRPSTANSSLQEHIEEFLPSWLCPPRRMPWDDLDCLPRFLRDWAQFGLTACEIGLALHRFAYGQDATLKNLVTTLVDAGKPYFEIGRSVLRNMHLCNDNGDPIWELVPDGNRYLKAMPEPCRLPPHEQGSFANSMAGFSLQNMHPCDDNGDPIWELIPDGNRQLKAMPEPCELSPREQGSFANSMAGFSLENIHCRGPRLWASPQPKRVQFSGPEKLVESQRASLCVPSGKRAVIL